MAGTGGHGSGPRWRAGSQKARDYETRMAERAKKEAGAGPETDRAEASRRTLPAVAPRRANTTDPHSRIIATGSKGVLQGYNAQAAATTGQIVVAAEATATTNDQPHFLPMATAVAENLTDAGHGDGVGAFVADAGYWTAANGTTGVGAEVLIATKKSAWRKADKPDDDKLAVLAKVNRGELSQRKAGEILGVSYTWVRDMTKRYFGSDGQRITRSAEPEPAEWIPVIEQVARGEISKRAARDELTVSDTRINAMLAHVRGEATDPAIARKAMDNKLADPRNTELYRKRPQHRARLRQHQSQPRIPAIRPPQPSSRAQRMAPHLPVHNLLKLQPRPPEIRPGGPVAHPIEDGTNPAADSCDSLCSADTTTRIFCRKAGPAASTVTGSPMDPTRNRSTTTTTPHQRPHPTDQCPAPTRPRAPTARIPAAA